MMDKVLVLMTATMYLPNGSEIKQAWQIVKPTTMDVCMELMTVRCEKKDKLND